MAVAISPIDHVEGFLTHVRQLTERKGEVFYPPIHLFLDSITAPKDLELQVTFASDRA